MKVTKEGWVTQHPSSNQPVEVVTAEYCRQIEEENMNMRGFLSRLLQSKIDFANAGKETFGDEEEFRKYVDVVIFPKCVVIDSTVDGKNIRIEILDEFIVTLNAEEATLVGKTPVRAKVFDITVRFLNYTPPQLKLGDRLDVEFICRTEQREIHGLKIVSPNLDGTYNCTYRYYKHLADLGSGKFAPVEIPGVPPVVREG